ncbi:MAG TPA: phosphatase PAP2 family protein [Geodermatophilus sp.]|nr:phosphatase PAP2 family protein [Geodermatophilus sp.]
MDRSPPDTAAAAARGPALPGIAGGLLLLVLLGAGVLVGFAPQVRLDEAVSEAMYAGDDRAEALSGLLEVLTAPGSSAFRFAVFAPVLIWLAVRHAWRTAAWVLVAIALIGPVTRFLKDLVGRVRPAFEDGGASYDGLSYPSGHSSGIATLVTVALVLAWPRLTAPARRRALAVGIALAVLVGLTRMWLGVHFLSDVVGGWSLGVAWSLAVALVAGGLPGGPAALPARAAVEERS